MVSGEKSPIHEHHHLGVFLLFALFAFVGVSALFLKTTGDGITGSTVVISRGYTECVDYGNYIILSSDAGWRLVKKDLCTGVNNMLIKKVACVKNIVEADPDYDEYTFTYTKVAWCENGESCARDENKAAYCPGDVSAEQSVS